MKKCPYCAEEIQDEAILCRYCHSDLTAAPPGGAGPQTSAPAAARPSSPPASDSSPAPSSPPAAVGPSGPSERTTPASTASVAGGTTPEPSSQEDEAAPEASVDADTRPKGAGLGDSFAFGSGVSTVGSPPPREEPAPSDAAPDAPPETPASEIPPTDSAAAAPEVATSDTDTETSDAGSGTSAPEPAAATSQTSALEPLTTEATTADVSTTDATARGEVGSAATGPVTYTHSGHRYVLGYGTDFFGIWDRQAPAAPVERFARTDDGWRQAWQRYVGLEPGNVEVASKAASQPAAAGGVPAPGAAIGAPAAGTSAPAGSGTAMQYTHSGQRYLLGYGADFFGIWDRQNLSQPAQRFPRTDDGWKAAWQQFAAWEPHSTEVGLGGNS